MSTIRFRTFRCSVCGKEYRFPVLTSTNTFGGSPDLDLRPPEMKRSTMPLWAQECPRCGFVSDRVSDTSSATRKYLRSRAYRHCDGIPFRSPLAERFYKKHRICLLDGKTEGAFFAVLNAAWACDDAEDEANAITCRRIAIELIVRMLHEADGEHETLIAMHADLMRRAGLFDELIGQYAGVSFNEEILNRIIAFQLDRAKEKDKACYRISDTEE